MKKTPEIITKSIDFDKNKYPLMEEIYITEDMLNNRVKTLAECISEDYKDKELVIICVLKGAICFFIDLVRNIKNVSMILDFIQVISYGPGVTIKKDIELVKDIDIDIKGKHVLIVEDIVDSGRTLDFLIKYLSNKKPVDIKVCTLLDKPEHRKLNIPVEYIGFVIPDIFIVGYGMDYDQKYRELPYMGILKVQKIST